jgi:hypothetical protein
MMFHVPHEHRYTERMYSDESFGNNGQFTLPSPEPDRRLFIQASDGLGWEHVSVHAYKIIRGKRGRPNRRVMFIPTWSEMCYLKDIFWDEDDLVVQYHPPKEHYVNNHSFVLHLWRPVGVEMPAPPSIMVGLKGVTPEQFDARLKIVAEAIAGSETREAIS